MGITEVKGSRITKGYTVVIAEVKGSRITKNDCFQKCENIR